MKREMVLLNPFLCPITGNVKQWIEFGNYPSIPEKNLGLPDDHFAISLIQKPKHGGRLSKPPRVQIYL